MRGTVSDRNSEWRVAWIQGRLHIALLTPGYPAFAVAFKAPAKLVAVERRVQAMRAAALRVGRLEGRRR